MERDREVRGKRKETVAGGRERRDRVREKRGDRDTEVRGERGRR